MSVTTSGQETFGDCGGLHRADMHSLGGQRSCLVKVAPGGDLRSVDRGKAPFERRGRGRLEANVPVGGGDVGESLEFAVDNQSHRRALHTACGGVLANLLAGDVRDPEAEHHVENTPSPRCGDEVPVDLSRRGESRLEPVTAERPEINAHHRNGRCEELDDMSRDHLALTVGVGGKNDAATRGHVASQTVDHLLTLVGQLVVGGEPVVDVDRRVALGNVGDVAVGGSHHKAVPKVLLDGAHLHRRLDDEQGRCVAAWGGGAT
jgi:hypothetical protein